MLHHTLFENCHKQLHENSRNQLPAIHRNFMNTILYTIYYNLTILYAVLITPNLRYEFYVVS